MSWLTRSMIVGAVVMAMFVLPVAGLVAVGWNTLHAAEEAEEEPAPPADQTYTGSKKCASCHFQQFMSWNKTKHAKAFGLLTAAYETNPECLKCHTTGYGEPTGFQSMAATAALAGITCETCHGPGSKHDEVCQAFGKKTLSPEEEKIARDTIWLILPKNICVDCHKVQGHGESSTPAELKTAD